MRVIAILPLLSLLALAIASCESPEAADTAALAAKTVEAGIPDLKPVDAGIEVEGGAAYRVGNCVLAGQPTAKGFEQAKSQGVKTVINLRLPGERQGADEKELVEAQGLKYTSVPVDTRNLNDATVASFLAAMKEADGPVMVHCGSGGRVAGLWAIHLVEQAGVPAEQAIAAAEASGLKNPDLKRFVQDYLSRHAGGSAAATPPESPTP